MTHEKELMPDLPTRLKRKPSTTLKILVIGPLSAEVAALVGQGHSVDPAPPILNQYDLILGPTCARYLPGMAQLLPQILKGTIKWRKPHLQ